jgi:hypothetical protein
LSVIAESSEQIERALKQALNYCHERGVGIGIVANGHQLIAFLASRQDGIPPLNVKGLVFSSLEDMRDGFRELWQHLSKPGLTARNVYTSLKGAPVQPPPQKLSQRMPTGLGLVTLAV